MSKNSYHILPIFILLVVDLSAAQISISKSQIEQIYASGKTVRLFRDTTTKLLNIGSVSGPNVYNFSNLPFSFVEQDTVLSVAQVHDLALHYQPSSLTLGQVNDSIGIEYPVFSFSSLFWLLEGRANILNNTIEQYQHYVPQIYFLEFPITYNLVSAGQAIHVVETTYVNGIASQSSFPTMGFGSTVDGYGTLLLPGMSLSCLRVSSMFLSQPYSYKEYMFLTGEGAILIARSHSIQPDTGVIPIYQLRYILSGSFVPVRNTLNSPATFLLSQNYPNPFNPSTTIAYQLPKQIHVTLKVFDVLGREVSTLVNEVKQPGTYTVQWDASGVASGLYFYRLEAGSFLQTKKLLLLR